MTVEREVGDSSRTTSRIRALHELLFSIYLPFLIISAHERAPGGRWAVRLVSWAVSRGHLPKNVGMEDNRIFFADFILLWLSVVLLFLILRLADKLLSMNFVLLDLAGAAYLIGYPLVLVGTVGHPMPFLYVELVIAALCTFFWTNKTWPVSNYGSFLLLLFHFVVWSRFGGGKTLDEVAWIAIWPPLYLDRGARGITQLHLWPIYPLLGLLSTLVWAKYFRQSPKRK